MKSANERLAKLGILAADVLLPKKDIDLKSWAVIACDQFSSEREYWDDVKKAVGDKKSTLNLIFPECYLEDDDKEDRIASIKKHMCEYVNGSVFDEHKNCFVLVCRKNAKGVERWGLIMALDLDNYSYEKGSKTLIRATEGTIVDRIPPRKKIREGAELELPHIMVLISDKKRSIIEPLKNNCDKLKKLYDTPLMCGGGSVSAWCVDSDKDLDNIASSFEMLYDSLDKDNKLLFAMGDGNHSFATAKSVWEDIKKNLSEDEKKNHPARYCLVEVENIFDEGLLFEPIHRVFFSVPLAVFESSLKEIDNSYKKESVPDKESAIKAINIDDKMVLFALAKDGRFFVYNLKKTEKSPSSSAVIQKIIDKVVLTDKVGKIDYTHGIDSTIKIGSGKDDFAILMSDISKDDFFNTILRGGAFPRKTFSIGEAEEKRYYMEARRIK